MVGSDLVGAMCLVVGTAVDAAGTFVYASFQPLVFETTLASGSALTFGLTATVNHGKGAC